MSVFVGLMGLALGAEHLVAAKPSEVTVYSDRAQVTRSARVSLPAGRQEVIFEGLPTRTQASGLTANASLGRILGVDIARVTAAEAADERVAEIEREIRVLQDRKVDLLDDQMAAQREQAWAQGAMKASGKALSDQLLVGSRGPARARALRRSLADRFEKAQERARRTTRGVEEVDREIRALQRERSLLGSSGTDTWRATVHIDMERAGTSTVELDYLVPGATWRPRYDLRGEPAKGKVDLALSALVVQRTGEDWDGVRLTVSSARPSQGTDSPTLAPFFLSRPRPRPRTRAGARAYESAPAPSVARPDAAEGMKDVEREKKMDVAVAAVDIQLAATSFVVARSEDVPSDGTERKVLLTTSNLDADLRYVVAPKVDPRAYLVAEVENTTNFPMLPGQAGVFLSGAFLGEFGMELVAPGESFDVAFGVDSRVGVERMPRGVERNAKIGVGKKLKSTWEWGIALKNGHPQPIRVEVWEQVPVSGRDDVEVSLLKSTAAPSQEPQGLLKFAVELPKSGSFQLDWGYTVTYPSELLLGWME